MVIPKLLVIAIAIAAFRLGIPPAERAAAQAAEPPANPTLQITAKPSAAAARPGGEIRLDVTIKNISAAEQTLEIAQNFWYAHSDNPSIEFFTWPKRAGHGPVVLFKTVALKPGETLSHAWMAKVAAAATAGPVKFRVGIPLHRDRSHLDWSEPLRIDIAADK